MQGFGRNIITISEKLFSFIEKLKIWKCRVENGNFGNFSSLDSIILENEKRTIIPEITMHLQQLSESFHGYFTTGYINKDQRWIPFYLTQIRWTTVIY